MDRRTRGRLTLVAVAAGAAVVGMLLVAVSAKPLLRYLVGVESRARGFEVAFDDLSVGWGFVELSSPRLHPSGVQGIELGASRLRVEMAGLSPRSIVATDARATLTGTLSSLARALCAWTAQHPSALGLPVTASGASFEVRSAATATPWLTAVGVDIKPASVGTATAGAVPSVGAGAATPTGAEAVHAGRVALSGRSIGPIDAGCEAMSGGMLRCSIGGGASSDKLHIDLPSGDGKYLDAVLDPVELDPIANRLAIQLPVRNIVVSAAARVELAGGSPPDAPEAGLTGSMSWRIHGWVPPHPRELDGVVFGNESTVEGRFVLAPDASSATLGDLKIKAGAFELAGTGSMQFEGAPAPGAHVELTMRGDLPCTEIARSAATAHLGGALGALVGQAARATLQGAVAVLVKIDADTRRLEAARALRTIGVGCGLAPLPLPDLSSWPGVGDLTSLLQGGAPAPALHGGAPAPAPAMQAGSRRAPGAAPPQRSPAPRHGQQ